MPRTKKKEDPISNIVESISYGTGLICAKVTKIGKAATKSKEWKGFIDKTQDVVKKAEKSVMDSVSEMKESFDEGVKSIVEEELSDKEPTTSPKKKKIDEPQEAEIITKEEIIEIREKEVLIKEQEVAAQKEEDAAQKKEVAAQEVKETESYPPLTEPKVSEASSEPLSKEAELSALSGELEPAHIEDSGEELMDEDEEPKKKEAPVKAKKKSESKPKEVDEIPEPGSFTIAEFKKDGKEPKSLMGSIRKNKPEIVLSSTDPLEWLNELLSQGDNGQPLKYDIQETPEIEEAKEAFEAASGVEKTRELIKLNRLILEQAYPLKCPKLQIEESNKPKSKRSKSSDSGLNLN